MSKTEQSKRSTILLIAAIIGIFAIILTWGHITQVLATAANSSTDAATSLGYTIGTAIILPHQIVATIACIFAALGWFLDARWGALVAGILYAAAMVLMIFWFYAVIVQMILCFVAYAKMRTPAINNETIHININQPEKVELNYARIDLSHTDTQYPAAIMALQFAYMGGETAAFKYKVKKLLENGVSKEQLHANCVDTTMEQWLIDAIDE